MGMGIALLRSKHPASSDDKGKNMKKSLALIAILLSLVGTAGAEVVGGGSGATPSSGLSANYKRASKLTLAEPATLTLLCAYLDGNGGGSGTQPIRIALYRDSGGSPGAKVAETAEYVVKAGDPKAMWCPDLSWTMLSAGNYWIAILSGSPPAVARYFLDGTATNWFGNADTYADGASSTFGSGNSGAGTIAAQLVYLPASYYSLAGNTVVGTRPSSGMSADYKRSSSFTMPTSGRLHGIRAYFDGHGSNSISGNQKVRLGLFRDFEGRPTELIVQTNEVSIPFHQPAYWIDFETPKAVLSPGRYWIGIGSGQNGGIGRYFLSGSEQNWYGNPDFYDGTLTGYFGTPDVGTGTISAFVSYQPGNFGTVSFGNSLGNPRDGRATLLTGNAVTGSRFHLYEHNAVLTAMRVFIDTLGELNRGQGLRMLVYKDHDGMPSELVAQSDEWGVNTMRPASWLTVPISATPISVGTYWLMVQSTESGVVHIYHSGDPNGLTAPDRFDDGPANPFDAQGTIVPASGTYAITAEVTVPR